MSPWDVELLFAKDALDRRALARDREKHLVRRVRRGVYVRDADVVDLGVEQKHVVAVRALVASSDRELVLSHWSAAVLHDLDVLKERLG
jgi:predicted transcriptional regulator of viral defense system